MIGFFGGLRCRDCGELLTGHVASEIDGNIAVCHLTNGLTIRTQSSVPVAPGTDATPDGGGDLQHRRRAGEPIAARDLIVSVDPAYGPWLIMRDGIAAKRLAIGQVSQHGRHAIRKTVADLFGVAAAEMVGPGR